MKRMFFIFSALLFVIVSYAQTTVSTNSTDSLVAVKYAGGQTDSTIINSVSDTTQYALLYVYRPKNFVGSVVSYKLKMTNSKETELVLGTVKNNSKFVVKLYQEGVAELIAKTEAKSVVKIDVKFGSKYYLKCGVSIGAFVGRPDLNLIYPAQGELDYEGM